LKSESEYTPVQEHPSFAHLRLRAKARRSAWLGVHPLIKSPKLSDLLLQRYIRLYIPYPKLHSTSRAPERALTSSSARTWRTELDAELADGVLVGADDSGLRADLTAGCRPMVSSSWRRKANELTGADQVGDESDEDAGVDSRHVRVAKL
jgi:hypothetical protein